jgi:segregation and condensation protein B
MSSALREIIECMIFVAMEPLSLQRIKAVLTDYDTGEIEQSVNELLSLYASNERGIQINRSGGGFLFSTKPEHDLWIRRLMRDERKSKLHPASLETLSVIAYNQPVTLAEISAIRDVDASQSLKSLLQKRLVKISGRKKAPGRPLLYRTTDRFLNYFGLDEIKDLPSQDEIMKILDEEKTDDET